MSKKPEAIAEQVNQGGDKKSKPPIEKWNPELSGDIDILVNRDGTWLYEGKPIGRGSIVRLFSTILRREEDGHYYLVTPVEKWRMQVEDTPLLAHSLTSSGEGKGRKLSITTSVGETLDICDKIPLSVGTYPDSDEPRPIIQLPHGVEARLVTAAYYELADMVAAEIGDTEGPLGIWSHGVFYKIA